MADVIENKDGDQEPDTLVQAWETSNEGVSYKLHYTPEGGDEVMVVEESEDGDDEEEDEEEPTEHMAMIAQSVEELDEAIEILQEIRAKMVARAEERKG